MLKFLFEKFTERKTLRTSLRRKCVVLTSTIDIGSNEGVDGADYPYFEAWITKLTP